MLNSVYKKNISLLINITLMCFIFYFSHQTGQESSQMSNNLLIRKLAHITEYAVLAFFVYAYVSSYKNVRIPGLVAVIVTIIYAASDEYHQTFIVGRSGNITDVLIDAIGVVVGVLTSRFIKDKLLYNK